MKAQFRPVRSRSPRGWTYGIAGVERAEDGRAVRWALLPNVTEDPLTAAWLARRCNETHLPLDQLFLAAYGALP